MLSRLELGSLSVTWLCGGNFQLDGGTMYGAVPKVLWNRKYPADEDNYIEMLNAPLLIQTPDANLLVDSGLGNKLSTKQKEIFRVKSDWAVVEELGQLGLSREDIDFVLLTHCDFDHAGGVVMRDKSGTSEITFPGARHIVQKMEWEDVVQPNIRSAHTYWPENFASLNKSGLLQIIDGDSEIVPGVTVRLTGGHTRGHQLVELRGEKGCAIHLGDLFPTHTHSNPLWIMAYDNFPLTVIELKHQLLKQYQQENCWFTFYHDIYMKACRLDKDGNVTEQLT